MLQEIVSNAVSIKKNENQFACCVHAGAQTNSLNIKHLMLVLILASQPTDGLTHTLLLASVASFECSIAGYMPG